MSNFKEFFFPSSSGVDNIRVRRWSPDNGNVRGTVQISHGISEYCERYDEFARYLSENGFAVYANDHLGHGLSIGDGVKGFFAEKDGWMKVVEDMHILYDIVNCEYPDAPHFVFGHSMGSFLTRTYLFTYPKDFAGAILCGTGHMKRSVIKAGHVLASAAAKLNPKKYSKSLENVAFGAYNNEFKPNRTPYDWLSRSEEEVDKYIADPLCGFTATTRLYADMMGGLLLITNNANLKKMNKRTPILFIAGDKDPVGENGEGVKRAYAMFRAYGMNNVEIKLYEGARHELLNEINKDEVMSDIFMWLIRNFYKMEEEK